jgi:hypothetical protein
MPLFVKLEVCVVVEEKDNGVFPVDQAARMT